MIYSKLCKVYNGIIINNRSKKLDRNKEFFSREPFGKIKLHNINQNLSKLEKYACLINNFHVNLHSILAYGVTGNTSDFGSEESRFEP